MSVPATFISPTLLSCVTTAHHPDTIMDPVFTGVGSSNVDVGGLFYGEQDTESTVKISGKAGSSLTYEWTATDHLGRPITHRGLQNGTVWNAAGFYSVGWEGVQFRFPDPASSYEVGDQWTGKGSRTF